MNITLNMMLYQLKHTYSDLKIRIQESISSKVVQGIRIFPESRQPIADYLYLTADPSRLSQIAPDITVLYVCDADAEPDTLNNLIVLKGSQSMGDIFNSLLEIFRMYQDWDRNLHEALIQNAPFSELLTISTPLMHNPILVFDLGLKLLAHNEHPAMKTDPIARLVTSQGYLPGDVIQTLSADQIFNVKSTDVIFKFPSPAGMPHNTLYLPFISDDNVTGYLVMLLIEHEDEQYERSMFRNFYEYADIAMNQLNINSGPKEFIYEYFLLDLINNPETDRQVVKEHCVIANLPYQSDFYLIEFQSKNYTQTLFYFILHQMRLLYPTACVVESNETISFFIYRDSRIQPLSYQAQLEKYYPQLFHLAVQYDLIGVVATSFHEIPDIKNAHQQAQDILRMKMNNNDPSYIYFFEKEYPALLIHSHGMEKYGSEMLPPALKEMALEDAERRTQNIKLLKIYFEENCNITQTAARLSMHRNNVVYHLRRLESHYGLHLDSAQERFVLQLYMYLMEKNNLIIL